MKDCTHLSTAAKHQVVGFLLEGSKNGRVADGQRAAAAAKFKVHPRTVARIWATARKQQAAGEDISLISGKHNPRKKRVHIDLQLIKSLEMGHRKSIRGLADRVNCSKTTVEKWLKQGLIKAHTNAIRPDLTAPNKLLRLRFSLEALEFDREKHVLKFKSMQNVVHIDEKWFYMTKAVHRFYIVPGEEEPHRICKSKKFITKVMFMCAVCRPLYDAAGNNVLSFQQIPPIPTYPHCSRLNRYSTQTLNF